MKIKVLVIMIQFFGVLVGANHQALFIFQEHKTSFSSDAAGMNIAHQLFACLYQKAGPILMSGNVWQHVFLRKSRFDKALKLKSALQLDVVKLVDEVNSSLKSGNSLEFVNVTMNQAWYTKKYARLAQLSEEKYKELMFDFLCSHVFEFTQDWLVYSINDYILFVLPEDKKDFNLNNLVSILDIKKFIFATKNQSFDLLIVLSKLLKKESLWSFYISGHGDHADEHDTAETIAGMLILEFKKIILFLEKEIKTNILVYSSCYSSGVNLMEPYQNMDSYKNLSYAIITTCLTDAPVYIYGAASGLVLPAYDKDYFLKPKDVKNKHLAWNFIQDFSQFKKHALQNNKYHELAQAIMPYKECVGSVCNVSQLENIPLIKRPKEIFFVPLDTSDIDFVVHNESHLKKVENKSGLLWYIKQYNGTVEIKGSLPQFINMIPGDGVIWTHKLNIGNFDLQNIISKLFFSIEDVYGVKVFIFDMIKSLDNNLEQVDLMNCMVIPKSSWIPKSFLLDNQLGICFYQHNKNYYFLSISKDNGKIIHEKVSSNHYIRLKRLWKLLRKESQSYAMLDALDLVLSYKKRQESYQEILDLCQSEKICS
jgi:hypothetical protein